jgi:hypothetical protein
MANETTKKPANFRSSPGKVFGKLEQVFDDVWWTWGTVVFAPGIRFPRNMVIVRERGELVVIHPVLMPDAEQKRIEALGPIKHMMRLGEFHGMDDLAYVKRYAPTSWAPPSVNRAEGITTHHELVPGCKLPLAGATLHAFEASRTAETVIHLERHDGMLLACDSVQNWEHAPGLSVLGRLMAGFMGFRGRACIGPGWRKASEPKDGKGFLPAFEQLAKLEFRHALGGHGGPIKDTARDDLRAQMKKIYKTA